MSESWTRVCRSRNGEWRNVSRTGCIPKLSMADVARGFSAHIYLKVSAKPTLRVASGLSTTLFFSESQTSMWLVNSRSTTRGIRVL